MDWYRGRVYLFLSTVALLLAAACLSRGVSAYTVYVNGSNLTVVSSLGVSSAGEIVLVDPVAGLAVTSSGSVMNVSIPAVLTWSGEAVLVYGSSCSVAARSTWLVDPLAGLAVSSNAVAGLVFSKPLGGGYTVYTLLSLTSIQESLYIGNETLTVQADTPGPLLYSQMLLAYASGIRGFEPSSVFPLAALGAASKASYVHPSNVGIRLVSVVLKNLNTSVTVKGLVSDASCLSASLSSTTIIASENFTYVPLPYSITSTCSFPVNVTILVLGPHGIYSEEELVPAGGSVSGSLPLYVYDQPAAYTVLFMAVNWSSPLPGVFPIVSYSRVIVYPPQQTTTTTSTTTATNTTGWPTTTITYSYTYTWSLPPPPSVTLPSIVYNGSPFTPIMVRPPRFMPPEGSPEAFLLTMALAVAMFLVYLKIMKWSDALLATAATLLPFAYLVGGAGFVTALIAFIVVAMAARKVLH